MALLEAKKLGISFGGLRAVDDFNISIEKGTLYGLIGPNGAGKTTVFNLLTGVYKPTEGIITLDGKDITGKKTELFRPPFGEYDDLLIDCAEKSSLTTIQWDVDSLDWKDLSAEEIANRVIAKVKSGSIILCHNNGLHTAESLPLIFAALKQKGYEFVPISKLVYKQNYTIDSSGRQILSE